MPELRGQHADQAHFQEHALRRARAQDDRATRDVDAQPVLLVPIPAGDADCPARGRRVEGGVTVAMQVLEEEAKG